MTIEDMYRQNYHIVRGYILSICGNEHLAEDIASETFLKAIRHHKNYDGTCRPSTWLCTIAKNLLYDEFRRNKRLVSLEQQESTTQIFSLFDLEQYIINKESSRRILELATTLKEDARQVFFMRLEKLSFAEIGDSLGKSENWARVTYFRAKNKILEEMEGTSHDKL